MIKTKHILIALAVIGANVLHNMPLHTALAAEGDIWWYGTTGGFVDVKPDPAVTTGVNLTITDSTQVNGKTVADVNNIYGGYTDGSLDVKNNAISFNTTNATRVDAYIYGGYILDGNVTNNTVTIENGTFSMAIYGGYINNSSATTTARGNAVIIDNGTFGGNIYAGFGAGGGAVENSLTINNGTFNAFVYGGNAPNGGVAEKNTVTINDGIFTNKKVYGGVSAGGVVTENEVIIKGGTFTGTQIIAGAVTGGSTSGNTGNKVTIEGGIFNNVQLYGGMGGTSSNNTLNLKTAIAGTATVVQMFQNVNFTLPEGATSEVTMLKMENTKTMSLANITFTTDLNGLALTETGDYVTLVKNVNDTSFTPATSGLGHYILPIGSTKELVYSNGTPVAKGDYTIKQGDKKYNSGVTGNYIVQINGNTTDGELSDTSYSGNEIIIRRGTYAPNSGNIAVAGAYNATTADAISNNTVKIYDGTFKGDIYGGRSSSGAVSGNTVNIYGGTLGEGNPINIYGGWSNGSNATGNLTNIEVGTFANGAYIRGGGSNSGNATKNTLTIKGGTFSGTSINFYGGESNNGNVGGNSKEEGNTLNIIGGTFSKSNFYGGKSSNGKALYNSVNVEGGTFGNNSVIYGGFSGDGTVEGNSVTIANVAFNGKIYGGYSENGTAENNLVTVEDGTFSNEMYGGYGKTGATGNIVTINGGTFSNAVCGGFSGTGSVNNNTLNIMGGDFQDDAKLYGGYTTSGTSTNNTLNLKMKMSGKVSEVSHFQNMNFTLPSNITNGDVMLKTASVTYDNTIIGVDAENGVKLNKNDVITLIEAENTPTGSISNNGASVLDGAAIVKLDDNNLILTLLKDYGSSDEDKQKAPVEGIAAAVQMVNQSADLASGEGMKSLIAETAGGFTNTFGALTTGQSKYKTGSHVDVDGWGILVGAGKTKDWGNGEATSLGVFFEYGKGDFDTYNGSVHGDGNSKNQGIGFMMRHKMMNNTYYEGNIRFGKQSTEWGESEIGSYDTDSRYYGISVGMGHIYQAGKNEIDVYGRYTYGHVGACDATVGTSEYHFDSVNSHRVRVGGKYNFVQKNSNAKPYVGIAWEHEFKGEARATISGVGEAPAPSMKGNTGILEVGCDWNVSKKWTVGLGANAYVGKRKGWDGMARVFYNF